MLGICNGFQVLCELDVFQKTDDLELPPDSVKTELLPISKIDIEKQITGLEHNKVPNFKEAVQTNAVKCILLEEPSYLKTIEEDLKLAMPHLSVSMSKPFFLEVAPSGIDKANSLKILAKKLNIHQSEIIAVGNAGNDLTMIEYAGLGVWVDNVTPELRHRGDVVVASNNNHGVAEVIKRYILG